MNHRLSIACFLASVSIGAYAQTSSPETQPTLAQLQAQLADLKRQEADVQARIDAAKKAAAATQPIQKLPAIVAKIPADLQRKTGENQRTSDDRDIWLKANFGGMVVHAVVKIDSLNSFPTTHFFDGMEQDASGLRPRISFDSLPAERLYVGDIVEVEGVITSSGSSKAGFSPTLSHCVIKSVKPAK